MCISVYVSMDISVIMHMCVYVCSRKGQRTRFFFFFSFL